MAANGAGAPQGALVRVARTPGVGYAAAPVRALLSLPRWLLLLGVILLVGTVVPFGATARVPQGWLVGATVSRAVDAAVDWMVVNWDPFFRAVNTLLLRYLLLPLERWLLSLPWWLVTGVVALVSFKLVGRVFTIVSTVMLLVLALFGLFSLAMETLALVLTSTILCVALGVPLGILASRSDRFDGALRPVLDAMQTMPSFVYLIPVVMLFSLGKVPAVLATFVYAVPPIIRLTNLGIRQVEVPLALPTIMAGMNQTIMMALAMVVIASMIGAKGLGVEVLNGIQRLEVGRGLLGGIGIVIMAIILDRITQRLGRSPHLQRAPS